MQQFVQKLLDSSDQWITTNAINDKSLFQTALKKVLTQLPSPLKETLSNDANIADLLWTKVQTKYASSSNYQSPFFLSEIDIHEYLKEEESVENKQKAMLSSKASLKHQSCSTINPFFKPYESISYAHVNLLLDTALSNKQCNNECLALIQFRFTQLLSNKLESKKLSNKTIRVLFQKLYRLFCHNLGNNCIKDETKKHSVALCFNQILLLCKDDLFCKDISMNILSFTRVFFDYATESKSFEAIQKCIDIKLLITKLFQIIVNRYDVFHHWSNTQRLIFLWTLYECYQKDDINSVCLQNTLKWSTNMWSLNGLMTVFSDKALESFADFTNAIYKHNMLSTVYHNKEAQDEDESSDEYELSGDESDLDVMDLDKDSAIIENINDVKDDDLFVLDMDHMHEPPTKKQRITEP